MWVWVFLGYEFTGNGASPQINASEWKRGILIVKYRYVPVFFGSLLLLMPRRRFNLLSSGLLMGINVKTEWNTLTQEAAPASVVNVFMP